MNEGVEERQRSLEMMLAEIAHLKQLVNARDQKINGLEIQVSDCSWEKLDVVLELSQRVESVTKEWKRLAVAVKEFGSVKDQLNRKIQHLEGSVKAKGDELASKVEEQKKMQEDMEIKLLEQEKQLNKKFLDKQKEMELEMETQLKKAKEVDGDKDGRIASLEDQLEALKLNMKQVEKNADAAIKQQMQQHANKADKEIAIKNSVIASLKSKIEEIESSQKVTIADKGLVTLSIFQLEEMKYNLRQEASEKVTGIADKGLVTLSIFELEKMKYNLRQEGRVKLAFKTKVKEMREAIEKDAAIKQQMQQHANKADKDIAIKNSVIADLTAKLESSEKKTGVVDKGLVTLSIFELEEIKYNPRQEGRTKLVIKKIVKDMRETIQAQRDELESRDSAMSALSRKLANLEAQAFDQDHEFRQQKTRQISLKAEVVSLKSQLGDKCKELSKLRRVFLEERAAKRDQDTGMKKRNRIIHLKGNSINNQPKSEETEDQTKFTANSGLSDHGNPPQSSMASLTVFIQDRNTHAPVFHNLPSQISISERTSKNIPIFQVNATDRDIGENAKINFKLISESTLFGIDSNTGVVTTKVPFDAFTSLQHVLVIQAGTAPLYTSGSLTISIVKLPENLPLLQPDPNNFPDSYIKTVQENAAINTSLIDINATVAVGSSTTVVYSILEDTASHFQIDSTTGVVILRRALDREAEGAVYNADGDAAVVHFKVMASAKGDLSKSAIVQITVLVTDYNDQTPQFTKLLYIASAAESDKIGDEVITILARDKDVGFRGRVSYRIIAGNDGDAFSISDPYSGTIRVTGPLNVEVKAAYNLTVQATDDGEQVGEASLSSTCHVEIYVADINDNDPVFSESSYTVSIPEDTASNRIVITLNATDKDKGENGRIGYRIVNGNGATHFRINNSTGAISVDDTLIDRELVPSYTLTVEVYDFGYPASRKSTASVFITLTDVNDNPPSFSALHYSATIMENSAPGTSIDFATPTKMVVTDPDSSSKVTFDIKLQEAGTRNFRIDKTTGALYSDTRFDRETKSVYKLTVRATDEGGLSAEANVTVQILDANDNAPRFSNRSLKIEVNETQQVDVPFFNVGATDIDLGVNAEIVYSLESASSYFTVDQSSGRIQLISKLDREKQSTHSFVVLATDKGTPPLRGNVTIHVTVLDAIDSKPYFLPTMESIDVLENATSSQTVYQVRALDPDLNDVIYYVMTNSSHAGVFDLDRKSGELKIVKKLDRELTSFYRLEFQAVDSAGLASARDGLVLTINVVDVNDHEPVFVTTQCFTEVTHDYPNKSIIFILHAQDSDAPGVNSDLTYSLSSNVEGVLSIDPVKGVITKIGDFSPFSRSYVNFTARVSDNGAPKLSKSLSCSVQVLPVNENAPKFPKTVYSLTVREDFNVGDILATNEATGNSVPITYSLFGGQDLFKIYPESGSVYTSKELDRETQSLITFNLIAQDSATPPNKGIAIVTVTVTDFNDNKPVFLRENYEFDVREDINTTTIVGQVSATDKDEDFNGKVAYSILPSQFSSYFLIDIDLGLIYTKRDLDRETRDVYQFTLMAADHGGVPNLQAFVAVKIRVVDVNDNSPVFKQQVYQIAIPEDTNSLKPFLQVEATDADIGANSVIVYNITHGNEKSNFYINEQTGELRVQIPLDMETKQKYNLTVTATDKGVPSLSRKTSVEIQVIDVNDNFPTFVKSKFSFSISENTTIGSSVGGILATDGDVSAILSTVYYDWNTTAAAPILDFPIDEKTGRISLNTTLDYERKTSYSFEAIAFNVDLFGRRSMMSYVVVDVHVLDYNDNAPVFPENCCNLSVSEKPDPDNKIIYTFSATDADGPLNNKISFVLLDQGTDKDYFFLSTNGQLRLQKNLDRETKSNLTITVEAIDSGTPQMTSQTDLRITVIDVNDVTPVFRPIVIEPVYENAPVGTQIATFIADDYDLGPSGVVSYGIISGNDEGDLTLDPVTGLLKTFKSLDYERTKEYKLKVQASDGGGKTALSTLKLFTVSVININDNDPVFSVEQPKAEVQENSPIGTIVTTIQASDADGDQIYFSIVGGDSDNLFDIGQTDGIIRTKEILDREARSSYLLAVEASNSNTTNTIERRKKRDLKIIREINITIADQNDNPPKFTESLFAAGISDDGDHGTLVLQVKATDLDIDVLLYSIQQNAASAKFAINQSTGWIRTNGVFLDTIGAIYEFQVAVKDNGGKANFSEDTTSVRITILNEAQRIVITMITNPDWVTGNKSDFIKKLENATGFLITIDNIDFASIGNGQVDGSRTELRFHATDKSTKNIVHRDNVLKTMEENYHLLETFFIHWNVTKYEGKPLPQIAMNDDDRIILIVAIVLPIVLVLFVIILLCCVCRTRRSRKAKIKAARIDAFKSERKHRSKGQDINMQPMHGDFRFSFFNQQALEPENQHYYTTEIDSRGTINRPRAVNPAAAPSQQMQRSGGFDSDDESEFESTKSSMKEEEYEGSVDTGDGIAKPKLGRSFSTFQGTMEPGDKNQYLDQPDHHHHHHPYHHPQMIELPPPKPPRQSSPHSKSVFHDNPDVDSLDDLTLLDILARQEKLRARGGGMPNRGADFDDLDSEMTSVVVEDDVDDVVTVPVYEGGGARGGGFSDDSDSTLSKTNPFLEELNDLKSTSL